MKELTIIQKLLKEKKTRNDLKIQIYETLSQNENQLTELKKNQYYKRFEQIKNVVTSNDKSKALKQVITQKCNYEILLYDINKSILKNNNEVLINNLKIIIKDIKKFYYINYDLFFIDDEYAVNKRGFLEENFKVNEKDNVITLNKKINYLQENVITYVEKTKIKIMKRKLFEKAFTYYLDHLLPYLRNEELKFIIKKYKTSSVYNNEEAFLRYLEMLYNEKKKEYAEENYNYKIDIAKRELQELNKVNKEFFDEDELDNYINASNSNKELVLFINKYKNNTIKKILKCKEI